MTERNAIATQAAPGWVARLIHALVNDAAALVQRSAHAALTDGGEYGPIVIVVLPPSIDGREMTATAWDKARNIAQANGQDDVVRKYGVRRYFRVETLDGRPVGVWSPEGNATAYIRRQTVAPVIDALAEEYGI